LVGKFINNLLTIIKEDDKMYIMEIEYKYNENTPPKEIILSALEYISKYFENSGYRFYKSKLEITNKTNDFIFNILAFGSSHNGKGYRARVTVNCCIENKKFDELYFGNNLGYISSEDFREWELYGKDNYENSLKDIIQKIENYFIPLTNRFKNDIDNLVLDVVNDGFYPNNKKMGYRINVYFLKRYGNNELLEKAIQKYYDNSISKHYEANKGFKELLFEATDGRKLEPYEDRDYIIRTIVENKLNITIK
jgi:hypothetical protein